MIYIMRNIYYGKQELVHNDFKNCPKSKFFAFKIIDNDILKILLEINGIKNYKNKVDEIFIHNLLATNCVEDVTEENYYHFFLAQYLGNKKSQTNKYYNNIISNKINGEIVNEFKKYSNL